MNNYKTKDYDRILIITFITLMIVKYGYYKFEYYPVLDDWIQYGSYPLYNNVFKDIIIGAGTYTTRPLASLSDPYIWGQFWGNMGIPFFIITILHTISGCLLYFIFKRHKLLIGMPFLIIYGLLPLGSEATYWISASSRIIVGLFWMTLSLYFLTLYLQENSSQYLWIYCITNFLSIGYYEQVMVLSVFASLLIIISNNKQKHHKLVVLVPLLNLIIFTLYYILFSNTGNVAQRGQLIKGNYLSHFLLVFDKITDIWGQSQIPLLKNGFLRGWQLLVVNKSYIFFILIIFLSLVVSILSIHQYKSKKLRLNNTSSNIFLLFIGLVLFWIPFTPNFLLQTIWICNRNAFTSFIGLGLILEGLFGLLLTKRNKITLFLTSAIMFTLTFLFLVVNISELSDYKNASLVDQQICHDILNSIEDQDFYKGKRRVIILNTQSSYIKQNSYFKDHIHNITSSDWALTGGIRAISQNTKIPYLIPVPLNQPIEIEDKLWDTAIILGIKSSDLTVVPLDIDKSIDGCFNVYGSSGNYYGKIKKEDKNRYIFTN